MGIQGDVIVGVGLASALLFCVIARSEATWQSLHYAYETGKKPGLALFIDGERDTKKI